MLGVMRPAVHQLNCQLGIWTAVRAELGLTEYSANNQISRHQHPNVHAQVYVVSRYSSSRLSVHAAKILKHHGPNC